MRPSAFSFHLFFALFVVIMQGEPYMKCVMDEGMPKSGSPFEKGRLFIFFRILFPQAGELGDAELALLAKALPGPTPPPPSAVSNLVMRASQLNI